MKGHDWATHRNPAHRMVVTTVGAAGALVALFGCSEKPVPSAPVVSAPAVERPAWTPPAEVTDWDPAAGTASITGAAVFRGRAPGHQRIVMTADQQCTALHAEAPLDEAVSVNSKGQLRNVFVFVKRGLEGWKFPVPADPVTLEQRGCVFVPHVLGVQVRQHILVRNLDPLLHNVHSYSRRNRGFNFGQTVGREDSESFTRPEVMVTLKCDIHPWMGAHIGVLPHPYFSVTGEDGSFELRGLPPGEYTIEAWHEVLGTKTVSVVVGDRETGTVELSFEDA